MKVNKEPGFLLGETGSREDLDRINALAKRELTSGEVYTFAVRLCDNEVDRDGECFDRAALEKLGELFVGKSGIFDHNWSAQGQTARLYKTELCRGEGKTRLGQQLWYLKGWAYMLRSEKNRELIDEIEAGIKKEVSIGCSVKERVCSVCGESKCGHHKGQFYDGKLCCHILTDPTDAYEWSFVAVPAQPMAGVMKAYACDMSLKELVRGSGRAAGELEQLEKEAEMGRAYMKGLRRELVRLAGMADEALDLEIFAGAAEKLEERELLALKKAYEARAEIRFPREPQLKGAGSAGGTGDDGAFLI